MKRLIRLKAFRLNNKLKTYLLLATVLIVWGVIALKINTGLQPIDDFKVVEPQNQSFRPVVLKVDTFSIQKVDRDPFLGTLYRLPKKQKKPPRLPQPKTLKQITYSGIVQNKGHKSPVFVVQINNRQYILKKGQTVDSVKLVRGTVDAIVVRQQKQLQTIQRNP